MPPNRPIRRNSIAREVDALQQELHKRIAERIRQQKATRLPLAISDALQALLSLTVFVETGTHVAATTLIMARSYRKVFTIELNPDTYANSKKKLAAYPHVECLFGDSIQNLPKILSSLTGPALFWLDAHYSGPGTAKGTTECPLIAEIALIRAANPLHTLFIDDARLFQAAPPAPHKAEDWPTIQQVSKTIGDAIVFIFHDVTIAIPKIPRAIAWWNTFKQSSYRKELLILGE